MYYLGDKMYDHNTIVAIQVVGGVSIALLAGLFIRAAVIYWRSLLKRTYQQFKGGTLGSDEDSPQTVKIVYVLILLFMLQAAFSFTKGIFGDIAGYAAGLGYIGTAASLFLLLKKWYKSGVAVMLLTGIVQLPTISGIVLILASVAIIVWIMLFNRQEKRKLLQQTFGNQPKV